MEKLLNILNTKQCNTINQLVCSERKTNSSAQIIFNQALTWGTKTDEPGLSTASEEGPPYRAREPNFRYF